MAMALDTIQTGSLYLTSVVWFLSSLSTNEFLLFWWFWDLSSRVGWSMHYEGLGLTGKHKQKASADHHLYYISNKLPVLIIIFIISQTNGQCWSSSLLYLKQMASANHHLYYISNKRSVLIIIFIISQTNGHC